jgi:ubiquinone/menaquinone biosynthesis C-methylase UbiE
MMLHQHPGGVTLTKRIIDYCSFISGAKVLDVGCGTGTTVGYLQDVRRLQSIGVDLSEIRLEKGRKCSPGLALIQAPGENLPFADASFDGVIAECSLSVMQDTGRVLTEISRVLAPGGKLAITDVYLPASDSTAGYLNKIELKKMLEKVGFTSVIWEDQSVFLREFVARYIMEHGSVEELWQCVPIPKKKLGYFLLVAEKKATKG